jgi:putative RNA 2'-phosphotransferase
MLKHQPKTLARTLDYIARYAPGEYGLFWDPDGAMPWKEFYWALQEDASLRFVREATIRELGLLGVDLPFVLDGSRLRLADKVKKPVYPLASEVPERLYCGLRPKNLVFVQNNGLRSAARPYVALCAERELALRIAKRRERASILIDILARGAFEKGVPFLVAGPHLYLVESVPAEFMLLPKISRDPAERLAEGGRKREAKAKAMPSPSPTPGSFTVEAHHVLAGGPSPESAGKGARKGAKGGWKKEGRKERHKRDL